MNSKQFLESTTSGSVATVATPVGKTQTRGKGVYPNEKGGNLLTGKKTNKKHPNSVSEAKLDEEDVIIVPGQGNRIKPGFIPRDKDRTDHEVEMALSDLYQSAKNAKQVYELIKDIPETVGIEGWVQEKIIKANDYLNTIREYLEHKHMSEMTGGVIAGGGVGEGVAEGSDDNDEYGKDAFEKWKKQKEYEKEYNKKKPPSTPAKPVNRDKKKGVAEGSEILKVGTAVRVPHKGKMVPGKIIRHDSGKGGYSPAYVVDIGEYESKIVPVHDIKQGVAEGYRILPNIDREKYQEREGLEGPFRARNGKIYYYDPKVGMAYDPDTDIYIDYDELKMMDTEMSEGIVGKVFGGAALLAALWGIGQNEANKVYSNSPQLQTLIKYHQMATQQGDQAKIQELERRIENHKTRLSLGKGEVMGADDKPIVPSFESSIMKGIQNEQHDDWGSMSKREFKRREMEHELGHETNNYAVVIDGRQWKVFADKRQAENIARSLKNKGKNASVRPTSAGISESKIPEKCPECGGRLVAESELNEEGNKDACYHKVKSRYKVWPSAYASGALVKCRKVGASNWGNKKK